MEQRKFIRFNVDLKVEAKTPDSESSWGVLSDFSREGLRVIFNDLKSTLASQTKLMVQTPNSEEYIPMSAEAVWKTPVEGNKWQVGFKMKEFSPEAKSGILEYGYTRWVKENSSKAAI